MRNLSRAGSIASSIFGAFTVFCLSVTLVVVATRPEAPAIREIVVKQTSGGWSFNSAERCFMRRINNIRARHGLGPATMDPQLGYVARLHAKKIAADRAVYHDDQFGQRVTNWVRLGQNTGRGLSCRTVTKAFMHDPTHREIILAPWSFLGVGAVSAGGRVYVQQLFESERNPGNVYNKP